MTKIYIRDMKCAASLDKDAWKKARIKEDSCFEIPDTLSKSMQELLSRYITERGSNSSLRSIKEDLWRYKAFCRFLNDRHKDLESLCDLPLSELTRDTPRAVITATDLAARKFVKENEVAFAVTGSEFKKMMDVTEECFFHSPVWKPVRNRLRADEHLEDAKFTDLA